MKGVSSYSFPAKRGWRGLAIAVLGLVILSMLVPLVFLLGLHNNFHSSVYDNEDRSTASVEKQKAFVNYDPVEPKSSRIRMNVLLKPNHTVVDMNDSKIEAAQAKHLDDLLKRLGPPRPKDTIPNSVEEASNEAKGNLPQVINDQNQDQPNLDEDLKKSPTDTNNLGNVISEVTDQAEGARNSHTKMTCELEFGSYCHWCQEHRAKMNDSLLKEMKGHLYVARAYFPLVAKLPAQQKFSFEMRQNIQDFEKILSEATTDADLPQLVEKKLLKMGEIIEKAKSLPSDCNYVFKKLRQILDQSEDESHFHMKQSAFLYKLAVQTMPKSLHCLSMRLTVEYFRSHSLDLELALTDKHEDPELHHYVILSKNILSASVVINSTVMHAKESRNQVFHVITDGENYYMMKFWFFSNSYKEATVHVLNIEDVNLGYDDKIIPLQLSLSEEYRVFLRNGNKPSSTQANTEYISLFGHTHFILPEIFQNLKKVVILDDDIVVQHDLSPLWNLQMEGKVNGAMQFCNVRLNQLKGYLVGNNYDLNSCSWMSGLNIIDLVRWRELNLTNTYRKLLQLQNTKDASWKLGSFPANLLTFDNLIYALDSSWVLSGLGHTYGIDPLSIEKSAVLHYNGNMKPWLELGIRKYKARWKKYLKPADLFMGECNVNP